MADGTIAPAKACTKCDICLPATREFFSPHKLGRFGLHPVCRSCRKAEHAEYRKRSTTQDRMRAWRAANRESVRAYQAEYRKTHKSTEACAKWRQKNLELARARARESVRHRRKHDPAFYMKGRIAGLVRRIAVGKAGRRTEDLLGYTAAQLRVHLERQFTKGMSWAAFMRGEIHIDHIVPIKEFGATTVGDPDFRVCWGLPNLRPMWARENMRKGSRRLLLL